MVSRKKPLLKRNFGYGSGINKFIEIQTIFSPARIEQ